MGADRTGAFRERPTPLRSRLGLAPGAGGVSRIGGASKRVAIRRGDLPRLGGYFTSEMRVTLSLPRFATQMLAPSKATP